MAQGDPQGWELVSGKTIEYTATYKGYTQSIPYGTGTNKGTTTKISELKVTTNRITGEFKIYANNENAVETLVYTFNADTGPTISDSTLYNQFFLGNKQVDKLNLASKKATLQLATNNSSTIDELNELRTLEKKIYYKSLGNYLPNDGAKVHYSDPKPKYGYGSNIPKYKSQGDLFYPEKRREDQDYIQFTTLKRTGKRYTEDGRCTLPIQGAINDANTVNWGEDTLNFLEMAAARGVTGAIAGEMDKVEAQAKQALDDVEGIDKDVIASQLAKMITGKNVVARDTGQVINPNLELLFKGPQLRPFQFNFVLSPRSAKEAKTVKEIIQFFKEKSAVRRANTKAFLMQPNAWKIEYIHNGGLHQSLNRIKMCAMQSVTTNYTPAGSYSTYNDAEATMTQYSVALTLTEIVPIYQDDYEGSHGIGY